MTHDRSIDQRVADLERRVDSLSKQIRRVHEYAHTDPRTAIANARISAEGICTHLFADQIGKPGIMMLKELIEKLQARRLVPMPIILHLKTIQTFGNHFSHWQDEDDDFEIDYEFIAPCLASLARVTSWYFEDYLGRVLPAGLGDTEQTRPQQTTAADPGRSAASTVDQGASGAAGAATVVGAPGQATTDPMAGSADLDRRGDPAEPSSESATGTRKAVKPVARPEPAESESDSASTVQQGSTGETAKSEERFADLQMLQRAAEAGDADAQLTLGERFRAGDGVTQDAAEAVNWYRKAAEQGDADAQFNLGWCYAHGEGVAKDPEQAVAWYFQAAEGGHTDAEVELGVCYENGQGVPWCPEEAVVSYRRAAEWGNPKAQYRLGLSIAAGRGTAADPAEAVRWYRKAAEQGHADAQFALAVCLDEGDGVTRDPSEAMSWYRRAAEQGHAEAQFILGWCYAHDKGVAKDPAEAVSWYQKAAEQGWGEAQKALAERIGGGSPQPEVECEATTESAAEVRTKGTPVAILAAVVGVPVERLLADLTEAGIVVQSGDSILTEHDKLRLLGHLRCLRDKKDPGW